MKKPFNINKTLTPNKLLFGRNISNEVTHERVETHIKKYFSYKKKSDSIIKI